MSYFEIKKDVSVLDEKVVVATHGIVGFEYALAKIFKVDEVYVMFHFEDKNSYLVELLLNEYGDNYNSVGKFYLEVMAENDISRVLKCYKVERKY